jgi:hypothetical protein
MTLHVKTNQNNTDTSAVSRLHRKTIVALFKLVLMFCEGINISIIQFRERVCIVLYFSIDDDQNEFFINVEIK